jgi:hypothetical protein
MLNHPTLDLLYDLGLHGLAKGFKQMNASTEADALSHAEWLGIILGTSTDGKALKVGQPLRGSGLKRRHRARDLRQNTK